MVNVCLKILQSGTFQLNENIVADPVAGTVRHGKSFPEQRVFILVKPDLFIENQYTYPGRHGTGSIEI
jgi:hypothetical protein